MKSPYFSVCFVALFSLSVLHSTSYSTKKKQIKKMNLTMDERLKKSTRKIFMTYELGVDPVPIPNRQQYRQNIRDSKELSNLLDQYALTRTPKEKKNLENKIMVLIEAESKKLRRGYPHFLPLGEQHLVL